MEEKVRQAYLYDFYGELLKERQRHIFEDFVLNDFSLGEIADVEGISRQGVHDVVKRCVKALEGYEENLHLLERFLKIKGQILQIQSFVQEMKEKQDLHLLDEISRISDRILEEL